MPGGVPRPPPTPGKVRILLSNAAHDLDSAVTHMEQASLALRGYREDDIVEIIDFIHETSSLVDKLRKRLRFMEGREILKRFIHEASMMPGEHLTGAFGQLVNRILMLRGFDIPYSDIMRELHDEGVDTSDIRFAVGAARTKEQMGEEWTSPEWAKE